MTIAQLLRILYARRLTIVLTLILAIVAGIATILVIPKKFVATASVVVNGRSDDPLRPLTASTSGGPSVVTQIEIIRRSRVAQRVVAELGLARQESWKTAWREATEGEGDFESWIASVIASGLTVSAGSDSNVVDLQYKSTDPRMAANMANAFADAYLATMLDLRIVPAGQYAGFFEARIGEARSQVERAQAKLTAFEKSNDIVGGVGKVDVENARLGELSSQLALAEAQAADSSSRRSGAVGGGASSPDVLQYPVVQELRSKVLAQEVKVKEMQTRVKPEYPGFKSAQAELDELRSRLASEMSQIAGSLSTAQRVGSSRVGEIRAAVNAQRQRVLSMQALRNQDDVMRRELESVQRNFDALMERQSQSVLESRASQSDASLLGHASVPFVATSPRVSLILLMATLGGLLAGTLLALGLEYFRPVVRAAEDLLATTGLPVLAVVPRMGRRGGGLLRGLRSAPAFLPR